MGFKCEICGRGTVSGRSVSHSKKSTLRKFRPNLQRVKVIYKGKKMKMWICTRCLRSEDLMKA